MWIPKAKKTWRDSVSWILDILSLCAIGAFAWILLKIAE